MLKGRLPYLLCLLLLLAVNALGVVFVLPNPNSTPLDLPKGSLCPARFEQPLQFNPLTRLMVDQAFDQTQLRAWVLESRADVYRAKGIMEPDEISRRQKLLDSMPPSRVALLASFDRSDPQSKEDYRVSAQFTSAGKACLYRLCDERIPGTLLTQLMYPDAPVSLYYPNAVDANFFAPNLHKDPMLGMVEMLHSAINFLSLNLEANLEAGTEILLVTGEDVNPRLLSTWLKMGFEEETRFKLAPKKRLYHLSFKNAYDRYARIVNDISDQNITPAVAYQKIKEVLDQQHPQVAIRNIYLQYNLAIQDFAAGNYERAWQKVEELRLSAPHDPELLMLEIYLRFARQISFVTMRGDAAEALSDMWAMKRDPRYSQENLATYLRFDVLRYLEHLAYLVSEHGPNIASRGFVAFPIAHSDTPGALIRPGRLRRPIDEKVPLSQVLANIKAHWAISDKDFGIALTRLLHNGFGLNAELYDNLAEFHRYHGDGAAAQHMAELARRLRNLGTR